MTSPSDLPAPLRQADGAMGVHPILRLKLAAPLLALCVLVAGTAAAQVPQPIPFTPQRVTMLIVVFVLETMVFPLGIIWLFFVTAKAILRPNALATASRAT